jgi:hypothetical protein
MPKNEHLFTRRIGIDLPKPKRAVRSAGRQHPAICAKTRGHGQPGLVAFVAGPESSCINGANLTVDGDTNA